MTDNIEPEGAFNRLVRWATTPPQAYGLYLGAVVLVLLVSFYAGTMKPKKTHDGSAPSVTAPRN